jgi:hypothetical protein
MSDTADLATNGNRDTPCDICGSYWHTESQHQWDKDEAVNRDCHE